MAGTLTQFISGTLPSLIETVEVRSAFSPPVVVNVREAMRGGPPNPVVQRVRPTLILKGGIGTQVIAPGGVASPDEWKTNLFYVGVSVAAVATIGTMFLFSVGVFAGKRRERRKAAA